jgi:hypothetical protein
VRCKGEVHTAGGAATHKNVYLRGLSKPYGRTKKKRFSPTIVSHNSDQSDEWTGTSAVLSLPL